MKLQQLFKLKKFDIPNVSGHIEQFIMITTSIIGGICLFLLASIVSLDMIFLSFGFQKDLLHKSNAYNQIESVAKDAIENITQSLPVENELKNMLNNSYMSIESQLIQEGVDSLVDGLLEYIKSETDLLPDVYIGNQFLTTPPTEIDRINLGSILLYYNKSYLIDVFMVIRQALQLLKPVPLIISFFILFLIFLGSISALDRRSLIIWWRKFFLSSGILSAIICFFVVLCLIYFPEYFNNLNIHLLSFDEITFRIFTSYLNSLLSRLIYLIIFYMLFSLLVSVILSFAARHHKYLILNNTATLYRKPVLIIMSFITIFLMQNLYYLKESYKINNPAAALSKISNYGSVSGVISAVDNTIYSLELIINDDKTGDPIPDINVRVIEISNFDTGFGYPGIQNELISNPMTANNDNFNNNTPVDVNTVTYTDAGTDSNGTANIILNKGIYKLELSSSKDKYILPEPFIVDIKSAGKNTVFLSVPANN